MLVHRRSHFQLLEVMVSLIIIVVCALPILNAYVNMSKAQLEAAKVGQLDHLIHLAQARIVESLYRNQIPWQEILDKKQESLENLSQMEDLMKEFKKASFQCVYQFAIEKPDNYQSNTTDCLIRLTLSLLNERLKKAEPISYAFFIYIKREGS